MMRLLLLLLLSFGLTFNTGCSLFSGGSDGDTEVAESPDGDEEEGDEEEYEVVEEEGDDSEEDVAEGDDEEYEDEEYEDGEEYEDEVVDGEEVGEEGDDEEYEDGDVAEGDDEEYEDEEYEDEEYEDDTIISDIEEDTDEDYGSELPEDPVTISDDDSIVGTDAPVKTYISVKKIKDVPFVRKDILANAVYLGRQGDNLSSISQKIYGSDRTDELLKINPNLARGVKVGDKVYYSSPQRPSDRDSMLTFYEDQGLPAENYTSQRGENIREISKKLLGDDGSWKEIWATNRDVESKWSLPVGTNLRYWPNSGSAGNSLGGPTNPDIGGSDDIGDLDDPIDVADNDVPPPPPPPEQEPDLDIPPPPDIGDVDPPSFDEPEIDEPPPPPPEPEINEPPPPPPPPPPPKPVSGSTDEESGDPLAGLLGDEDSSFNLLMIAGGVFLLLAVLLIVVRRRRSRRINLGETQV